MKNNLLKSSLVLAGLLSLVSVYSHPTFAATETSAVSAMGPSFHGTIGIRMKKAPDLDTYYSTVGGIKVSLFGLQFGQNLYVSMLAPGLLYAGYGVFAPTLSPMIFYHNIGIGFSFDLFPVRADRAGGPIGMSFNFDVPRLISFASGAIGALR